MNSYAQGLLIVALGVTLISPDSAVIRLIDLDPWSIIVWRSAGSAIAMSLFAYLRHRGKFRAYLASNWPLGLALVPLFAVGQISFVAGVSLTAPAVALVLVGATPFFTAIVAWFLIGERSSRTTQIAILIGFVGVAIAVAGGSGGEVTLIGNLFAVSVPISLAFGFTIARRLQSPDVWLAFGLSHALAACIVALVQPVAMPPSLWDWGLLVSNGMIISAGAMALITLGLRYLPAAEVSLLMTGETVLGPLLVWWWVGLAPGTNAWIGGALVIAALVGNAGMRLRSARRQRAA
jgi:drug/metabolite transporter (DMT)-like permease